MSAELSVLPEKIGFYSFADKFSFLRHSSKHAGSKIGNQHSDESHRIEAYIKDVSTGYVDTGTVFIESGYEYKGIISKIISSQRSDEDPIKIISVYNKQTTPYFKRPETIIADDTTIFNIAASAGYPFKEPLSPNIDFKIKVTAHLELSSGMLFINVDGEHDQFPAYELLIDDTVIYNYNPSRNGQTGPGVFNLNRSIKFSSYRSIKIDDFYLKTILYRRNKIAFF